jgi:L-proline amide hydrolase
MLAMEYALTQPEGLASLILASSPASIPQWIAEANRLRKELPQEVEQTLRHHEEAGTEFKEMNHALKERAEAVPEGG